MDAKKKAPVKKLGKKQFKSYAVFGDVAIADMTKEQIENHVYQLQQEVEQEREERNYYQIERDKIQLFWEMTKQKLDEKDTVLQLKDREIDEAALCHLAEIKLYKQKMKHIMFECQQYIDEKMKEKMSEKLVMEEERLSQVSNLENEMNNLKDEILQLKMEHENALINQRMKHSEELCSLHEQYQTEIDVLKSAEVSEIGSIRRDLDLQRRRAIQEIEDKKDGHIDHLIQTHEELFQKMKNYYNDIIKNDILLVKSLKDKMKVLVRKECHYKETVKMLQTRNNNLSSSLCSLEEVHAKHHASFDLKDNKLYSTESAIRNLQRELERVKSENNSLFEQLQQVKEEKKNVRSLSYPPHQKESVLDRKKLLDHNKNNLSFVNISNSNSRLDNDTSTVGNVVDSLKPSSNHVAP